MKLQVMVRDMKVLDEAVPILTTLARLALEPEDAAKFTKTMNALHDAAGDAHGRPQRNILVDGDMEDGVPDATDVPDEV